MFHVCLLSPTKPNETKRLRKVSSNHSSFVVAPFRHRADDEAERNQKGFVNVSLSNHHSSSRLAGRGARGGRAEERAQTQVQKGEGQGEGSRHEGKGEGEEAWQLVALCCCGLFAFFLSRNAREDAEKMRYSGSAA